jgi:hypothetical protein
MFSAYLVDVSKKNFPQSLTAAIFQGFLSLPPKANKTLLRARCAPLTAFAR